MPKLIISTTGTTLFFVPDVVTPEEKTLLTRHANETNPPETLQALAKSVDNDPSQYGEMPEEVRRIN